MGYAYKDWCVWKGFNYEPEWFEEKEAELPYIPSERELDQLIAGVNPKYSAFLQLLKESGFRPSEARSLTTDDIDLERRTITLNKPAKRSNPRQFRMSIRLAAMLHPLLKPGGQIWTLAVDDMSCTLINRRRALAQKLGNPNLLRITFKTFRHWKATMEYLGHKSIKNTLIYTHLVQFEEENAFIVKVASTIDEYTSLLESGFEYVSDYEGKKILRKRK
jgi:integrase